MRKSAPILPLRIYDSLYDQRRFEKTCDEECQQEFIVSSAMAPKFQFQRGSSLYEPVSLIMRNICRDRDLNFYKLVPEGADTFSAAAISEDTFGAFPKAQIARYTPDGSDSPAPIVTFAECGGLTMGDVTGFNFSIGVVGGEPAMLVLPGVSALLPNPIKYSIKLIVDRLVRGTGNTFEIRVYNGDPLTVGELLYTITAAGTYTIPFYAINGNDVTLQFWGPQTDSDYLISYFNVTNLNPTRQGAAVDDFAVDEAQVIIKQLADGTDIVTYCSDATDYKVTPGTYYYILNMGHGEYYYSELFTVKTPQELLKYYCLTWYNTESDLGDVIYNTITLNSTLQHIIYLNAELFNPQYLTDVDVEKNGAGGENPTFKRWQKTVVFDVIKSPPFLTDALSAIFLHEIITLRNPSNTHQDVENEPVTILKVESEVADILENCYQAVKLTLTLSDVFTKTNCTDAVELFECPGAPGTPVIMNVSVVIPGEFWILQGINAVPGSFVVVEYNGDASGWVTTNDFALTNGGGNFSVSFDGRFIGSFTDLDVRVVNKTLDCTFNTSATQDII